MAKSMGSRLRVSRGRPQILNRTLARSSVREWRSVVTTNTSGLGSLTCMKSKMTVLIDMASSASMRTFLWGQSMFTMPTSCTRTGVWLVCHTPVGVGTRYRRLGRPAADYLDEAGGEQESLREAACVSRRRDR